MRAFYQKQAKHPEPETLTAPAWVVAGCLDLAVPDIERALVRNGIFSTRGTWVYPEVATRHPLWAEATSRGRHALSTWWACGARGTIQKYTRTFEEAGAMLGVVPWVEVYQCARRSLSQLALDLDCAECVVVCGLKLVREYGLVTGSLPTIDQVLGTVPDRLLCKVYDVTVEEVRALREARGVPVYVRLKRKRTEKDLTTHPLYCYQPIRRDLALLLGVD